MGREIRRVPKGWEHPRNERGHLQPMYDEDFETAAREWLDNCLAWEAGTHKDCAKYKAKYPFFWMWNGTPPDDPAYYRPKWTDEERTCWQVYETVSEGTPTSPVFESEAELLRWLIGQGHNEASAREFIKGGWAPSMVMRVGDDQKPDIRMNVDALDPAFNK